MRARNVVVGSLGVILVFIAALYLVGPIGQFYDRLKGPSFPEKKAWARDLAEGLMLQDSWLQTMTKKMEAETLPVKIIETGYAHSLLLYFAPVGRPVPSQFSEFGEIHYSHGGKDQEFLILVWDEGQLRPAIKMAKGNVEDASAYSLSAAPFGRISIISSRRR